MARCWETRGCDEEWMSRCPHALANDICPADCWNTVCERPTHVMATDPEVLLNPYIDYNAAIKETCRYCEFFLNNGPRKQ